MTVNRNSKKPWYKSPRKGRCVTFVGHLKCAISLQGSFTLTCQSFNAICYFSKIHKDSQETWGCIWDLLFYTSLTSQSHKSFWKKDSVIWEDIVLKMEIHYKICIYVWAPSPNSACMYSKEMWMWIVSFWTALSTTNNLNHEKRYLKEVIYLTVFICLGRYSILHVTSHLRCARFEVLLKILLKNAWNSFGMVCITREREGWPPTLT